MDGMVDQESMFCYGVAITCCTAGSEKASDSLATDYWHSSRTEF
jgi:hypothetical protein